MLHRYVLKLKMDVEPNVETVVRGRARKRQVNAANWKKKRTKLARNTGQAYESTKKYVQHKQVPVRVVGPPCTCGCYDKVGRGNIQYIFDAFWECGNFVFRMGILQIWSRVLTYIDHVLQIGQVEN